MPFAGGAAKTAVDIPACLPRRSVELQALLLILENATFACPENEAHLISSPAPAAPAADGDTSPRDNSGDAGAAAEWVPDTESRQPFCAWLVQRLPDMYGAVLEGRMPRECLHSALAVLLSELRILDLMIAQSFGLVN